MPKSYVLIFLDGRSFSHLVKNKFKKPFDEDFIRMMNETAKYLCENVSGCKLAYVQSDEISLVLTDFDDINTESFFGFRINKMLSIIASLATAKFNQLMFDYKIGQIVGCPASAGDTVQMCRDVVNDSPLYQFDCKVWNVPRYDDVFGWFLYRQIDCVRNSKQQAAQTWLSHSKLKGLNTDQQIARLKDEHNIDWMDFDDGKKYGRFVYKEEFEMTNIDGIPYTRNKWTVHNAFPLTGEGARERFDSLQLIPHL